MTLLKDDDRNFLIDYFDKNLVDPVEIVYFSQKMECEFCEDAREIYEEISSLSPKIKLTIFNFAIDSEKAREYRVDKIPAAVILGKNGGNVKFYGIPSGYEFTSLIEALVLVSKGESGLSSKTKERLKLIKEPVHIEVFVTPTCPYCPRMVILSHKFAIENPYIYSDMVEITEFPQLAVKYNVYAVPKTVVNGKNSVEGALSERAFLDFLLNSLGIEGEGD